MADVSDSELKEEIEKILKDADLAVWTTKKVIQQLQKQYGTDVRKRKDDIDKMVLDFINKPAETPKKTKEKKPAKKGRGTGFTRSYKLSPALADLMGSDELPRHAVVKRIWAIVKENNLYDPNNKQYAICDDAMFKVIGKRRFKVFGMMKYLKGHFLD